MSNRFSCDCIVLQRTAKRVESIHGIIHGLFFLDVVSGGLEQFPRTYDQGPFRFSNTLGELGSIQLEERSFVKLSPCLAVQKCESGSIHIYFPAKQNRISLHKV